MNKSTEKQQTDAIRLESCISEYYDRTPNQKNGTNPAHGVLLAYRCGKQFPSELD